MTDVEIKRVYEPYEASDGFRVLVDRLWPRGLTKERVHYDLWEKGIAPSTALRKAFGHVPSRFPEFAKAYRAELDANPEAARFAKFVASGQHPKVTLLYAAHDTKDNQAVVLKEWLEQRMRASSRAA